MYIIIRNTSDIELGLIYDLISEIREGLLILSADLLCVITSIRVLIEILKVLIAC